MSVLSKSFAKEAPAVLDEGAWHDKLKKNTVFTEYQQTLMFVMNNSHHTLTQERRKEAADTLLAYITKTATAEGAQQLGQQAIEFALTETAFYIESNKFDIAFLKASLAQPQHKEEKDHAISKIEMKQEQIVRYTHENESMQDAEKNLSPEALGAALLAKLAVRARKEGLTEAGQQAYEVLSGNFDLPGLTTAALASKAAEYFSLPAHLGAAKQKPASKAATKMAYSFPAKGAKLH